MNKVELLAPAGNLEIAKVAIASGADAIYIGGKQFGARSFAQNFTEDDFIDIVEYAHLRNAKVYVTVNTTIYDSEFDQCLEFIDFLYMTGIDAIIIQDLGLAMIARKRYPNLALHASTQMNVASVQQAQYLKEMGFSRIVLARELTLAEIKNIKDNVDIELEVFVHGAICISYSGNCYLSSFNGGRSGNRGKCAQPCRLTYQYQDQKKYFISPKELCTIDNLDEILKLGIESLKIEGRMKRQEYVACVVKEYRSKLDNKPYNINNLKLAFNREFTKGFILNEHNHLITNINQSNHNGLKAGKVLACANKQVTIKLEIDVAFGDSLRIVKDGSDIVDAITINEMYLNNKLIKEAKKGQTVVLKSHRSDLYPGYSYLTASEVQKQKLLEYAKENDSQTHKIKATAKFFVKENRLILVLATKNYRVRVVSDALVEESQNDFTDRLISQIKKTNSLVEITNVEGSFSGKYLPIKDINALRREAVDELLAKILYEPLENRKVITDYSFSIKAKQDGFEYIAKVNTEEQLLAALNYKVKIYVQNKALYEKYKANNVYYYNPRITDTIELGQTVTNQVVKGAHALSVYANVTNAYSVINALLSGYNSVGLSIEMSLTRIKELTQNLKKTIGSLPNLEFMIYGRQQLMIMKHCFVNKAHNLQTKNCKLCQGATILTDEAVYPLDRDEKCHLLILNDKPLWLYDYIDRLKQAGINRMLLDFTNDDQERVNSILDCLLNNKKTDDFEYNIGHLLSGDKIWKNG